MSEDHDASHEPFLPRPLERETPARLDALLAQVSDAGHNPRADAGAVASHVAELMAGISQVPDPGRRHRTNDDPAALLTWLELELGDEIDRFLSQLWNSAATCPECNRIWTLHLLAARDVIRRWVWNRDLQARLQ